MVQEYERAVIFRLGLLLSGGARGPGVFFVIPCVDVYQKIDMRTQTYDVPPQEILTKDSVTVFVNAIMYYKVKVEDAVDNISLSVIVRMLPVLWLMLMTTQVQLSFWLPQL